ncbi:MAG: lipid-binding SYLF domain-containing protein [Acidobacteria bacterium]|nr:lipid-binding SYLF domain-containing protein [Acidobacteriota bacterium]
MKNKLLTSLMMIFCLTVTLSVSTLAFDKEDAVSQARKSATVFKEIMATPDKGVPGDILDKAFCVAVFPQVIKAGFIVGGRGGRGVASCRTKTGWSAPAFFDIKGGSFGLQIGAQATDLSRCSKERKRPLPASRSSPTRWAATQ